MNYTLAMKKIEYSANKKLPIAFYLAALIVFATLLGSSIVLAIVIRSALTRNEMILTCVSSFVGLFLSVYGLYNALKNHVRHSFFLAGMHLTLLSLSGFFHNLIPLFMDPSSTSMSPWGVTALVFFCLLVVAGLVGALLPHQFLFARKMVLILAMTLLIVIEAITFISDTIGFAQNGLGSGQVALLSLLSAYTHLAPIAVLGVGIAYLYDTHAKNVEDSKENK